VRVYKGVPYAAPPVGALRWRPPQPAVPWSGVRRADEFGPCCQQTPWSAPPWTAEFVTHERTSEGCLYLNVWTGAHSAGEKRPVLVWLHGGGFSGGSGAVAVYDGAELARRGLVVVTINYRLGALGFLALPALTRESPNHASGNYALLDCIAALRWVSKNIGAFGGDPGRVTLAGQSAGAEMVSMLMYSPLARGLFHRAILQSGGLSRGFPGLAAAEDQGTKWAGKVGAASLESLRAKPAEDLMQGGGFGPVADGWCVPAGSEIALQNDVPILFGMTADEGSDDPSYGKVSAAELTAVLRKGLGPLADEALSLYPFTDDSQAGLAQTEGARDRGLFGTLLWARERATKSRARAFPYYFTRGIPWPEHPSFGAFHSSDVPYAFANLRVLERPWQATDHRLADTLAAYWANFATTGDPNGAGVPPWPAFDSREPRVMELGTTIGPRPFLTPERLAFFERCAAQTR
jgi:para-nitrobenzyl esterase